MRSVVVEGTLFPAAGVLPRGEQATWAYTERVEDLVRKGHLRVIEYLDDDDLTEYEASDNPHNEPETDPETAPARNASLAAWQAWFTTNDLQYPESAGRDDLVAAWTQIEQQRAGGS